MDLMSLLAKLTLDKEEYDKGLEEAEKEAKDLQIATPSIPKTDNSQFEAGLKEAEETGNMFKEVMSGVWQGVKDAIVTTGILALVSGFIGAMRQGISLAVDGGKAIADNSKNLQLSTRAYQEYEYVLGKSNLQVKDLSSTISKLDTIRGGKITETQAGYFEKLGINAEEAASGVMSTQQMLDQLMTGLANYEGADKGAIIDAFFGKSDKWTGYFEQSEQEIKKLKKEADDLGLIMSDESIENAVKFTDATEKLSNTLEGIKLSFGESVLPLLTEAANTVAKIIAFFGGGEKSLSEQWIGDDKAFAKELIEIEGTAAAANSLADKLLAMGDTSKMTAEQYQLWQSVANELISTIPSLQGVIDTETGVINGNTESIRENIKAWEERAKVEALNNLKAKKQQDIADKYEEQLDKQAEAISTLSKVDGKRAEAIATVNEALTNNAELSNAVYGAFGTKTLTDENADAILSFIRENGFSTVETDDAFEQLAKIKQQAEEAQKVAAEMDVELAKARQEYTDWEAAADSMFGSADSSASASTETVNGLASAIEGLPDNKTITIGVALGGALAMPSGLFSNAKGNWTVPYDNFPALLHRDEMVLTKSQARQYREGNGSGTDVSGAINNAVANAMSKVYVMMNGDKVGDLTTKRVRKNINTRSYNKLRAMGG